MISVTLARFWQLYRQLPAEIREAARNAYQRFAANPRHPSLQFHRLARNPILWSARVTKNYRAVGILQGDTITWIWIGTHDDFDRAFPK